MLETTTNATVLEWAPFTLASGAGEADLLRASEALQEGFLARQPGFLRRDLLKGRDREWIDLVWWATGEDAERAMQAAAESPACFEYFRLMAGADHAEPGAGVSHYLVRRTYT